MRDEFQNIILDSCSAAEAELAKISGPASFETPLRMIASGFIRRFREAAMGKVENQSELRNAITETLHQARPGRDTDMANTPICYKAFQKLETAARYLG